jgi:hypothetical protein
MVPKHTEIKKFTYHTIVKGLKSGSYINFGYDKRVYTFGRWISNRGVWGKQQ